MQKTVELVKKPTTYQSYDKRTFRIQVLEQISTNSNLPDYVSIQTIRMKNKSTR